jgi:DNA-directed RNA polymerase subunit K
MKVTRFERARILGARSLQIAMGAPPLLDDAPLVFDALAIATEEHRRRLVPLAARRTGHDDR